jgi:hypothetical protein
MSSTAPAPKRRGIIGFFILLGMGIMLVLQFAWRLLRGGARGVDPLEPPDLKSPEELTKTYEEEKAEAEKRIAEVRPAIREMTSGEVRADFHKRFGKDKE